MSDAPEQTIEESLATSTAPANIPFELKGFADEQTAKALADKTATYIRYIGTRLNLEDLAGVTMAFDYANALTEIDRGYETQHVLTPSTEIAHGVAMAPGVFRDGVLKTYLAFNAGVGEASDSGEFDAPASAGQRNAATAGISTSTGAPRTSSTTSSSSEWSATTYNRSPTTSARRPVSMASAPASRALARRSATFSRWLELMADLRDLAGRSGSEFSQADRSEVLKSQAATSACVS